MDKKLSGSRAQAAGTGFENVLAFLHQQYENKGLATILRVKQGARTFRKNDGSIGYALAPSLPDFIGSLEGGQTICFDAKSSSNKYSWHLGKKKVHQAETLSRLAKMGAICFFQIESRVKGIVYLLRIDGYDSLTDATPKITWSNWLEANYENGEVLRVFPAKGGGHDYLPVIGKYWLGRNDLTGLETL